MKNLCEKFDIESKINDNSFLTKKEKEFLPKDFKSEHELEEFMKMVYLVFPTGMADKAVSYIYQVW